jgi:hypothetical protein
VEIVSTREHGVRRTTIQHCHRNFVGSGIPAARHEIHHEREEQQP